MDDLRDTPSAVSALPAISQPPDNQAIDPLCVQAAAVAAQQAAMFDQEIWLQRRQIALDHHEIQLGSHLEDKRCRLAEMRDQFQKTRAEFEETRQVFAQDAENANLQLQLANADIEAGQRHTFIERRRLIALRRRLKQRLHRHWAAEHEALRKKEQDLAARVISLDQAAAGLRRGQLALNESRHQWNGEKELSRRRLDAAWEALAKEQNDWAAAKAHEQQQLRQRDHVLLAQAAAVKKVTMDLAGKRRQEERISQERARELEGLERRIAHSRQILLGEEKNLTARENEDPCNSPAPKPNEPSPAPVSRQSSNLEAEWHQRIAALDNMTEVLADQRCQLTEQWARLLHGQETWENERFTAAAAMTDLASRLDHREIALEAENDRCRVSQEDLRRQRRQLERWRLDLTLQAGDWEGERDRLLTDVQSRENLLEQRIVMVAELRRRWRQRYLLMKRVYQMETATQESARHEIQVIRDSLLHRQAALVRDEKRLAAIAMAQEQFRQEAIVHADNPATADKQLHLLRRQWEEFFTHTNDNLQYQFRQWEKDLAQSPSVALKLVEKEKELQFLREKLLRLETTADYREALTISESARLREEVACLQAHRAIQQRQMTALTEELERVAHQFMKEESPTQVIRDAA